MTAAVRLARIRPSARAVHAVNLVAAAATLGVLLWRVGTGPFVAGLRTVDLWALGAAVGLAVATTLCCAWRWRVVARRLGVALPLATAVTAYYRSLFLNVTLPGGVVGDVHRGLSHGRATSEVGRALRAVAWERAAGQAVQIALTAVVLLVAPSPVHAAMPFVAPALLAVAAGIVLAARRVLTRRAWAAVAPASAAVVAGHVATFVVAAHAAGVTASPSRLIPLALLILLAAALPNVGGWGPREGVTAWAFAAVGLGASRGVATAVVYGVLVFAATLPGAVVLLVGWVRHHA